MWYLKFKKISHYHYQIQYCTFCIYWDHRNVISHNGGIYIVAHHALRLYPRPITFLFGLSVV